MIIDLFSSLVQTLIHFAGWTPLDSSTFQARLGEALYDPSLLTKALPISSGSARRDVLFEVEAYISVVRSPAELLDARSGFS
jgi:hypothetical protein